MLYNHHTGGCHSHRLYSHSCDRTQSTVNGQTARIGGVNGQSGVKKMVNVQVPVQNGPDHSAVIRGVTNARSAYFLTYKACGLGLRPLWAKYLSGQRSMAKN